MNSSPLPVCRRLGDLHARLPVAWIGYSLRNWVLGVRVCAWCAEKTQAEELAKAEGLPVTHSVCIPHYQEQLTQRFP